MVHYLVTSLSTAILLPNLMYFLGLNSKLSKITKSNPMDNFNMDTITTSSARDFLFLMLLHNRVSNISQKNNNSNYHLLQ